MHKNMNSMNKVGKWLIIGSIVGTLIAACGGGGSSTPAASGNNTGGTSTSVSGVAASGAPIVGQVVAIDANGKTFAATTSASGAYTVNVAGGTAPFILTVVGMSGGKAVTLNSVATAVGQTVNITPLTDLIVSTAAGQPGGAALANLCASNVAADQVKCKAALTAATTGTNLSAAVAAVTKMIAPLNTAGIDPLNGAFTANGTGMDGVLDAILVTPAAGQGAMATVTLIAVPTQQLGTVTMPAAAGGVATPVTVVPPTSAITATTTAATALSEIQVCLASLSALYPTNMTTPPTVAQVTPFIDPTFMAGGAGSTQNQTWFINNVMTVLASAGGIAQPGLTITSSGLAAFDFTPQLTTALAQGMTTASPVSATAAWVRLQVPGNNSMNWKMVKGAAYTGCAGGWRVAGDSHVGNHMDARVSKWMFTQPTITYTYKRELPLHVQTASAVAEGIGSIVVSGPGLAVYSGNATTPFGATTPITLVVPPVPVAPAVQLTALGIQGQMSTNGTNTSYPTGSFYFNAEAIQSCQDLGLIVAPQTLPVAGTPCYDETAVAPGAVFTWTAWSSAATPAVLYAYSYQVDAVPLSLAFAQANDKDLFVQNITPTPATVAALNTAATAIGVGAPIDNIIKFNYTMSAVYGGTVNNCNVGLVDSTGTTVLMAEQNAMGQQTSCTFVSAGLNSGNLNKPATAFVGTATTGWTSNMSVSANVLGNQIGSGIPYL